VGGAVLTMRYGLLPPDERLAGKRSLCSFEEFESNKGQIMSAIRLSGRAVCSMVLIVIFGSGLACRKDSAPEWKEPTLSFAQPQRVEEGTCPALARDARTAGLYLAFYSAENFRSATEPEEHILVYSSSDGGGTWTKTGAISTMVAYGVWGFDFQRHEGKLYFIWTSFDEGRKKILLTTSADDGETFSLPVEVNSPQPGQRRGPTMAVAGTDIYAAWLDDRQRDSRVFFSVSTDGGKTWAEEVCLEQHPGQKAGRSGNPAVAATGKTVHCCFTCLWKRADGRVPGTLYHAVSRDKGKTWQSHISCRDMPLTQCDLAISPDDPGTLYIAATAAMSIRQLAPSPRTDSHVYLLKSTDGGKTWEKGVRIDDHASTKNRPRIRLDGERITVVWDDAGRDGLYATVSEDGGKSWCRNIRIGGRSRVGITEFSYQIANERVLLVWGDLVKGKGDNIFFVEGKRK